LITTHSAGTQFLLLLLPSTIITSRKLGEMRDGERERERERGLVREGDRM